MLTCILGGCGTGKSWLLAEEIRQKLEAGKKVLVIVPEQFSFEAEKRLYAKLGAALFNRLHTYSFATLSRDILQAYGTAARNESYASEQEKLLYLYQAVQRCSEQKELLLLEKRRNAPDFIMNLYEIVTKIRRAGVSAEMLLDKSPMLSDRLQEKTHDLGKILFAYDSILREKGRFDDLVNLTEAAGLAEMQYFFENCHICIDEFDSFTGDQYQMLEVILKQADEVTAAIRADDPTQRPTGIFMGGNNTFQQLRMMAKDVAGMQAEVQYLEEYRRSRHSDLKAAALRLLPLRKNEKADYQEHVHIFEASDPVMETEYLCANICSLLRKNENLRCRDIAIAVKNPSVYFPLLERAMKRYDLPYDLSTARSVLHRELIRYFLTLLELISGSTWQTETILRYVKSPLSGFKTEQASMLEHFCFTWSIDKNDWEKPFWKKDDKELEKRTDGFWGQALENLRTKLMKTLTELRNACQGAAVLTVSARKVCMALYEHMSGIWKRFMAIAYAQKNQDEAAMLWKLLMDVMDTVVQCFGDQKLAPQTLYDSFLLLLQNSSFSTPPRTLDSIRIVDAQTARLDSPAIVFVPGVSEGEFPAEVQAGGMFSQQELRELETWKVSISRLLPELHSDELLIVRKTLSAPTEQLYLSYPLTDANHAQTAPAGLILQLLQLFPENCGILTKSSDVDILFYVRTMESGYFHYVRNLHRNDEEMTALRSLLQSNEVYASRLEKLLTVQEPPKVSPETMQLLLGDRLVLSPSGIERFAECPFRYFCQYILHLYIPERNTLTARSTGNFAHYCLEQLLRSMSREQFLALSSAQLQEEIIRLSEKFSGEHFPEAVRGEGRFQFQYRQAGKSLVQLLENMQAEMAEGKFVPKGFEVPISEDTARGGFPPLSLRNGEIICHGSIDRVDVYEDETARLLRVIDYKTGIKSLVPEKIADGLDMQMLIYLFALRQNGAYDNADPSGVFYMPSGQPGQKQYQNRSGKTVGSRELLRKFYQMKGLLLDSTLPFMEEGIQGDAASVMQTDSKTGLYTVNARQMAHLQQHVEQKICDMADALHDGQIAPEPNLRHDSSPCKYCAYIDICGKTPEAGKKCSSDEKKEALIEVFGEEASGKEETK